MNHAGETKLLQANWRITLEIPDCLRQIDVLHWKCEKASGKLIFPVWFFNLPEAFSRITYWKDTCFEAMEFRRVDSSVRLRLFLVSRIERIYILKRWSVDDLILPSAWGFFYITYWRDISLEAMDRRRLEFSVCLRLFCVSRIEGIRIRRGMGVRGRRCAATWDWRWQNEKRSRMRLSSGSLRFSRRHRGALCTG